jgi:C-terminal processing protease CtpA/Prc
MKVGTKSSIAALSSSLAIALFAHVVYADELLKPEIASLDATAPASQSLSTTSSEPTLYGGVKKKGEPLDTNAGNNDNLQAETPVQDAFKLAVQKLSSGAEMTPDDYRALNIGVNGVDCEKFPNEKYARVIAVYRGGPGDLAGIKVGEKIVWDSDKDYREGEHISWTFKKVGDHVPVTVIRHGKPIIFDLVCENMEDIQEPKIRRAWEKVARRLGYPKDGVYSGTNNHDLTKVHD